MPRRCDGNRLGSIAAVVVALSASLVHQTQARKTQAHQLDNPPPPFLRSRPSWRVIRRSTRTGLSRSICWMGQTAKGAECLRRNSRSFILRLSLGCGTRWPSARPRRKPSRPVVFPGCRSIWQFSGARPPAGFRCGSIGRETWVSDLYFNTCRD
jgi:hypothetical protein